MCGKVKHPMTGLDRPLGIQEDEAPRFFRQSAHEGGKVVSPTIHVWYSLKYIINNK
jgi:hypothetical protein